MTVTPAASSRSASGPAVYRPRLHRYCVVVAAATLVLISAGGLVTSHEAGLSVPDWPTSYGHNMFTFPPSKWVGNVFYEHTHRLIASTVGFLMLVLAVWLWRVESRRWMRWLGMLALAAVTLQGLLGGLTVKFLLPPPVSIAHACLAQSFFCMTVAIAVCTSRGWIGAGRRVPQSGRSDVRRLALLCTMAVFLQLVLGAVMRHTRSGLAVPDFPRAYGQWLPALDVDSVARYNLDRRWDMGLPQVTRAQIVYHLFHRAGAVAAAGVVVAMAALALGRRREYPGMGGPAAVVFALLVLQLMLGAATVLTGKIPMVATAHVAVGAALLAAALVLTLRGYRLFGPPVRVCPRSLEGAPAAAV